MRNFKIEANELLQRNELKSVFGGLEEDDDDGGGTCTNTLDCNNGSISCTSATGNCKHGKYSISCDGIMYTCTLL